MDSNGGHHIPSLLDAEARGGDTAEGGFSFQENMLVSRIPGWLRQESFSELIREALGDVEARFFAPGEAQPLEFLEYKDHTLTPSEFWKEVRRFRTLDEGHPGAYERFVLVSRGLSPGLRPLLNALRRVRDAYPFYQGLAGIQDASFEALVKVVEGMERTRVDARFLFIKVSVESDAADAEKLGPELFSSELCQHFPDTRRLSKETIDTAFEAVRSLLASRKNRPVSRAEIEAALWSQVPDDIRTDREPVRIFTAIEPVEPRSRSELVLQWGDFFGGRQRRYPPSDNWERMKLELQATKDWIVAADRPRRIALTGTRRLSSSLCCGSVFSAVSGFVIEMDYRGALWRTDDYGDAEYRWQMETVKGGALSEIAVVIGILRDIDRDVSRFLQKQESPPLPRLTLLGTEPILGPASANAAVATAKMKIAREISKATARVLHLFVAGPAPFALFLGHRLNAMCEVQSYERTAEGSYVKTCRICA